MIKFSLKKGFGMSKTNISTFMRRKNLSQSELAKILNCTNSMVSLYISGKSGISSEKMQVLIELGITPEELFGDKFGGKLRENTLENCLSELRGEARLSDDAVIAIFARGLELMQKRRRG